MGAFRKRSASDARGPASTEKDSKGRHGRLPGGRVTCVWLRLQGARWPRFSVGLTVWRIC